MAVLYCPHFAYFTDDDGQPLAGGKLYTYESGTTTPKATYTAEDGLTPNANPVVLDASGRATLFLSGSYKFRLTTSADVLVEETDNVTAFATGDSGVDDIVTNFTEDTIVEADSIIFSDSSDGDATKRTTVSNMTASTSDIRSGTVNKIVMAEEMSGLLGWQLLSTQTASASATLDFTSVIVPTFNEYVFVLENMVPATDDSRLFVRTSTDNGSTFDSSGYSTVNKRAIAGSATISAVDSFTSGSAIVIGDATATNGFGNAAGESFSGVVRMFNPLGTSLKKIITFDVSGFIAAGSLASFNGAGSRDSTADIDAVRFLMASGNITSGVIRCYGLKK